MRISHGILSGFYRKLFLIKMSSEETWGRASGDNILSLMTLTEYKNLNALYIAP